MPGFQETWNLDNTSDPILENSKAPSDNENSLLDGAINRERAVGNYLDILRQRLCLTKEPA